MTKKNNNKNNQTKGNNNSKSKNAITNTKKKNTNQINNKNSKPAVKENSNTKNSHIMKLLVFFGVLIFSFIIVYLMYHFFVEESDIKINMSTDKQMEYIMLEGEEELIMTQKYVSDLAYSMRYDVNDFRVFKYKNQDIYKNLNDERVLVVVEKSILPSNCGETKTNNEYNNCYIKLDNYTEEYYISTSEKVYKITIKSPGTTEYTEGHKVRINHMIESFVMTN